MQRLVREIARLRVGDYFVFWNSSHGYQVKDKSGDELHDGVDEAICPYDTDPRDPLMDDKLAQVFSRANPHVTVFMGSDSCHSGTLSRATVQELTQSSDNHYRAPRLWIPPDDIRFRAHQVTFDLSTYFDETSENPLEVVEPTKEPLRTFGRLGHPPPEVQHVLLSGCKPEQVSWDARLGPHFHGAMTYHFAKAVYESWNRRRTITYREAHAKAAEMVRQSGFDQDPQLEGADHLKDTPVFGYEP